MPTISAILLASGGQKYELRQSLLSVRAQSRSADEVIIADASSGTGNREFVKDLLGEDGRYIFINLQEPEPVSDRMLSEAGARNSTGDYLAFLKAGDVWDAGKLDSVARILEQKDSPDLVIHSCLRRISTNDEEFSAGELPDDSLSSVFYALAFMSAAVMRRNAFFAQEAFSAEELGKLRTASAGAVLSGLRSGAQKDRMQEEKRFWDGSYGWLKEKGLLQPAALFCIRTFQKRLPSKESFTDFAGNTGLAPEDCIPVLFGRDDLARAVETVPSDGKLAERRQRFYVFVRNWLEFKVSGGKVSEKLRSLGLSRIAVYGAGRHGGILCRELQDSDVEILFWLDSSPRADSFLGIPVFREVSKETAGSVDGIVVTPFLEFRAISESLEGAGFRKIISIEDVTK